MSARPNPARRSAASRDAILAACLEVVRDPQARVSIEAIARKAGVGKQTIYRWWPSIGAVLADAVVRERERWPIVVADTGDLFEDLTVLLGAIAKQMSDPAEVPVLTAIIAQMQTDASVRDVFHEAAFGPIRGAYRARLSAARAAGQLQTTLSDDDLLDMLFGPLWFRLLTRPDEVSPEFAATTVATLRESVRNGP